MTCFSAEVTAYHIYRNAAPDDNTISIYERSKTCCLDRAIFHRKDVTKVELEEFKDFLSGTRLRIAVSSTNVDVVSSSSSSSFTNTDNSICDTNSLDSSVISDASLMSPVPTKQRTLVDKLEWVKLSNDDYTEAEYVRGKMKALVSGINLYIKHAKEGISLSDDVIKGTQFISASDPSPASITSSSKSTSPVSPSGNAPRKKIEKYMEPVVSSFHLKRNLDEELNDDDIEGLGIENASGSMDDGNSISVSRLVAAGAIEPPMSARGNGRDAPVPSTPPSIHDTRVEVMSQLTNRISPSKTV